MFITGPDVIKTVTGEEPTFEELGGAMTHNTKSGVAHFAAENEEECLEDVRYLMSFLPLNNLEKPPRVRARRRPGPHGPRARHDRPGRTRRSPTTCATSSRTSSTTASSSRSTSTGRRTSSIGFSRLNGHPIGVVGNQPRAMAGVLDIDASVKGARFVRFCDAFNIPLLTFCDVPGFLPGHEPGVGRHHPPRREAALRVHRGDGAEADGRHAQGLRRRLRRHELQAHARRLQLRLADRRRSR